MTMQHDATTINSDEELRRMRDAVYPAQRPTQIQSDEAWNFIKHKWRADEAWLRAEYKKVTHRI